MWIMLLGLPGQNPNLMTLSKDQGDHKHWQAEQLKSTLSKSNLPANNTSNQQYINN